MKTLILVTASLFLASCAATQTAQTDEPPEQKSYRTGSHLPVRDNSAGPALQNVDPKTLNMPAPYIPPVGGPR